MTRSNLKNGKFIKFELPAEDYEEFQHACAYYGWKMTPILRIMVQDWNAAYKAKVNKMAEAARERQRRGEKL